MNRERSEAGSSFVVTFANKFSSSIDPSLRFNFYSYYSRWSAT